MKKCGIMDEFFEIVFFFRVDASDESLVRHDEFEDIDGVPHDIAVDEHEVCGMIMGE